MQKLNTMSEKVKEILTNKPKTRDDDNILFAHYLNSLGVSVCKTSYWEVSQRIVSGELLSLESVGRVRRKVQELYPELGGSAEKRKIRYRATEDYREFARQKEI